jgi:hypothetical protein
MPATRATKKVFVTPSRSSPDLPLAVRKLGSGAGGRPSQKESTDVPWNLDCHIDGNVDDMSDEDDEDDESVASKGSSITVNDLKSTKINQTNGLARVCTPPSSPNANLALQETPEMDQNKKRKAPVDCHVLIHWSALKAMVTKNMASAMCGMAITRFDCLTVGIARELDFDCPKFKSTATVHALGPTMY